MLKLYVRPCKLRNTNVRSGMYVRWRKIQSTCLLSTLPRHFNQPYTTSRHYRSWPPTPKHSPRERSRSPLDYARGYRDSYGPKRHSTPKDKSRERTHSRPHSQERTQSRPSSRTTHHNDKQGRYRKSNHPSRHSIPSRSSEQNKRRKRTPSPDHNRGKNRRTPSPEQDRIRRNRTPCSDHHRHRRNRTLEHLAQTIAG